MSNDAPLLKRSRLPDGPVGSGLALAALALYLFTLAPGVLEADTGEFQFVAWLPGIAHPTGYPLYILLGWLWTHLLPFGEVAWRMNLLSAVLAAGAVGLTYGAARLLLEASLPETPRTGRTLAAAIAAATFGVSHTFWSQAIVAEVYALHTLFVVALLWLALKLRQAGFGLRTSWAKYLSFTFGLSLAHHRTIVLLLPALVLFFVAGRRLAKQQQTSIPAQMWVTHLALLIAPLLLYLYLPLIAPRTPYASLTLSDTQTLRLYENSLQGFWDHVMGTVFTGELQPAAAGLDRLILSRQLLRQQVGWVGVVLGLAGLGGLWQRRQFDLLGLTGLGLLGFVAFNLIYFIGDVFVLFIPAWLFVCLWLGLGILGLANRVADNFVRDKIGPRETAAFESINERLRHHSYQLVVLLVTGSFVLLPIVLLATRIQEVDQSRNVAAGRRWQQILAEPLPQGAVLVSNDRNEIMPMWYFQYVEQRRPDLLGLFPLIVTEPAYANVGRVLDQALASGRPVYLIKPMAGLDLKANLQAEGTLFRATALEPGPPAYPHEVVLPEIAFDSSSKRGETIKLLGYDLAGPGPGGGGEVAPGEEITVTLHWLNIQELSINYTSYVHLVASDGRGITQNDHRPGGDFYPSSLWQVGEILRDRHTLAIPPDTPAGMYRLRVGMYYQPEPGLIIGMGEGEEVGLVKVSL